MPDNNHDEDLPKIFKRPRLDADKGREPKLVPAQMGRRLISLNALAESVVSAFIEEYGDDAPALRAADSPAKRLKLVLETAEYVLSVESAQISQPEKADLINRAYSELFGYGPLDPLFLDERVTTISLEGADKASVRYGQGDFTSLGAIFQNTDHLKRVINRILMDAEVELTDEQPIVEVGFSAGDRPASISLVAPPIAFQLTADIRVHPKVLPTWADLTASGFVTEQGVQVLTALTASTHGLLVVGEPEAGKTTLLSRLANHLPNPGQTIAVERAGELRLPPEVRRLVVKWSFADQSGVTFGEQITAALEQQPACILLDEVRSDEPLTIAPLLQMPDAPRQIWSFRGAIFAKRLQSALGMLARRADSSEGETMVKALYERLPYVVSVNRIGGRLRLWSIGEWQFRHSPDYPTYTVLMQVEEGQLRMTGERPMRKLNLDDDFWNR
jgi:type IV secretory pathway ATPase VirB11/archaellum biosynthesis ATPase